MTDTSHGRDVSDRLSERHRHVLGLIAEGASNRDIAEELGVTLNTMKTYIRDLYHVLGVTSREEAIAWWAARDGLASLSHEGTVGRYGDHRAVGRPMRRR